MKGFFGNDIEKQINEIVARLPEELVQKVLELKNRKNFNSFGSYPFHQELDQAALDLKMLEAALIQNGLKPSARLIDLVNTFAQTTGQLPCLTYEDLIYINPVADPRTFTTGKVGNSEFDFYRGHRLIEENLEEVTRQVTYALYLLQPEKRNLSQATTELSDGVDRFHTTLRLLQEVTLKMPKEHFAGFRKYLGSHPTRDLKGPSGNFTPAIPVLDMLIGGENLPDSYYDYLKENEMYYPRLGRRKMAEALKIVNSGGSLLARCEELADPAEFREQVQALSKLVITFRGFHYKGVQHQIPDAIKGTGGEEPGPYLRDRMKMRHIK